MSLLLDALRKSEDQRRKGQLPSIEQPLAATSQVNASRRTPRLQTLLLVVAGVALIVIAVWWFAPGQSLPILSPASTPLAESMPQRGPETPTIDSDSVRQSVDMPPARPAATAAPDSTSSMDTRPSPDAVPDVAPDAAPDASQTSMADDAPSGLLATDNTTDPVEPADQADPVSMPPAAQASSSESNQRLSGPQDKPVTAVDSTQLPESDAVDGPVTDQARTLAGADPEQQTDAPPPNNFIYPWELPLDARQHLPELDLTVHVFTQDPSTRFVLINDQRFAEGDQVSNGVELVEINREGAILDFRNYRILLQ